MVKFLSRWGQTQRSSSRGRRPQRGFVTYDYFFAERSVAAKAMDVCFSEKDCIVLIIFSTQYTFCDLYAQFDSDRFLVWQQYGVSLRKYLL